MTRCFLSCQEVLQIHRQAIDAFGGEDGLRDRGLLESALAQPQATFGSVYLHPTLYDAASAYLFHIVSGHPFVDGNKRTGLATSLIFLELNGLNVPKNHPAFYDLTMDVASGTMNKKGIAQAIRAAMTMP